MGYDIVHLWSGGVDSTVALISLMNKHPEKKIAALTFFREDLDSKILKTNNLKQKKVFQNERVLFIEEDLSRVLPYYKEYSHLIDDDWTSSMWPCFICKIYMFITALKIALNNGAKIISTGNKLLDDQRSATGTTYIQGFKIHKLFKRRFKAYGVEFLAPFHEDIDFYANKKRLIEWLKEYDITANIDSPELSEVSSHDYQINCGPFFLENGYIRKVVPVVITEQIRRERQEKEEFIYTTFKNTLNEMIALEIEKPGCP